MKTLKRNRLKQLVSWGYITQQQANRQWQDYLRLHKRTTKQQKQRGETDKWWKVRI